MKLSLSTLLFVLFLGLQLTGHITWPWLWVFAPLWIPLCITMVIAAGVGMVVMVAASQGRVSIKQAA